MEEIHFAFWLSSTPGISNNAAVKLLDYAGSFKEIWNLSAADLSNPALNLSVNTQTIILSSKNPKDILTAYEMLRSKDINFLHCTHPLFPDKLRNIHNPPIGIYLRGKLPCQEIISVAVIGARTCSEYGRYVSRKIGAALGASGIQVISGLARGIDVIAQKGALDAGGYSCGVLGCGADICYPKENQAVYDTLLIQGGVLSEYPPQTPPKAGLFPMRNRIISALSDVVLVIEARERSGSLITADLALEMGREVYALPGRVTDSLSHGCNRLIRQGAGIVLSPEEFINDLTVNYSLVSKTSVSSEAKQLSIIDMLPMSEEEKKIMNTLDIDYKSVNEIQNETGMPTSQLMSCLTQMALRGLIVQSGSKIIRKM